MRSFLLFVLLFCSLGVDLSGQGLIARTEPANWWVGMHNPRVQVLFYGDNMGDWQPVTSYPGVTIERTIRVSNNNYLFVDLLLAPDVAPGEVPFLFFKDEMETITTTWPIWPRAQTAEQRVGFDNSDALYLITPDRFANGDPRNDAVAGMREQPDRNKRGGRHGGDIAGMRQHLDYIKEMGFTAIWVNPLPENDMEDYSYHGYSTTDFYRVDPRFGSNEEYRQLAAEASSKGIKLIMDMIVNHCGLRHWWMEDLPTPDWINTFPTYTQTNHRKTVLQDPHAAAIDRQIFSDGWFVPTMPDLNQRNPLLAKYLIQNTVWWVEYLGLAGIRMDTYPYPDENFMAEWTKEVMAEYPLLNIVGEEWFENPAIVSYWQRGKQNANGYTSYLPSLMDFPLQQAVVRALNEDEAFNAGWITAYEMLAMDFLYAAPDDLVVFPDNHDMSRIYAQVGEDQDLFRMAIVYFLTIRGIPQLYYGTEVLMSNPASADHGDIRADFPGGWAGDQVNAFTGAGLTKEQQAAKDFVRQLLHWRQPATAVHTGKLTHFLPQNGSYVYFRYDTAQKVMVIFNKNKTATDLDLTPYAELLHGMKTGKDVLTGKTYPLSGTLALPGRATLVLEVK